MELKGLFVASLSPSTEERTQASEALVAKSKPPALNEQTLCDLLELVVDKGEDESIRKAAIVYLKNVIIRWYGKIDLSNTVAERFRKLVVQGTAKADNRVISKSLNIILGKLVKEDYPTRWETLKDDVATILGSDDGGAVVSGCLILTHLLRLRKLTSSSQEYMELFCQKLLHLLEVSTNELLGSVETHTIGIAETVVRRVLKPLYLITHEQVPKLLAGLDTMKEFIGLLLQLIRAEKSPKCRKWALKMINNVWFKHCKSAGELTALNVDGAFDKMFVENIVPGVCRCYLDIIDEQDLSCWPKAHLRILFRFFDKCLGVISTRHMILHRFNTVSKLVTTSLTLSDDIVESFELDLVSEFQTEDCFDDTEEGDDDDRGTVESLAAKFTTLLLQCQQGLIQLLLQNVHELLVSGDALSVEAGLRLLNCVPKLRRAAVTEKMVHSQVLPLLDQQTFVSYRALVLFDTLMRGGLIEDDANDVYSRVLGFLQSDHVLLQVQAIKTLTTMVSRMPTILDEHAPKVKDTIALILHIRNVTKGAECFEGIFQRLFNMYRGLLMPHAEEICDKLNIEFQDLVNDGNDRAAQELLATVGSILSTLHKTSGQVQGLLAKMMPSLYLVLSDGDTEFLPDALVIVDTALDIGDTVTSDLWKIFEWLSITQSSEYPHEFDELLSTLCRFVRVGAAEFAQTPQLRQMLVSMVYQELVEKPSGGEHSQYAACALAIVSLFQIPDAFAQFIPALIKCCTEGSYSQRLFRDTSKMLPVWEQALASYYNDLLHTLIYYQPAHTLRALYDTQKLTKAIESWLKSRSNRPCSTKIELLALLRIISSSDSMWLLTADDNTHGLLCQLIQRVFLKQYLDKMPVAGQIQQHDTVGFVIESGEFDAFEDVDLTDMQLMLDWFNEIEAYKATMEHMAFIDRQWYERYMGFMNHVQQDKHYQLCQGISQHNHHPQRAYSQP